MQITRLLIVLLGIVNHHVYGASTEESIDFVEAHAGDSTSVDQLARWGLNEQEIGEHTNLAELQTSHQILVRMTSLKKIITALASQHHISHYVVKDENVFTHHDNLPILSHVSSLTIYGLHNLYNLEKCLEAFPNVKELHLIHPSFTAPFSHGSNAAFFDNHEELQEHAIADTLAIQVEGLLEKLERYAAKGVLQTFSIDEAVHSHEYFKRSLRNGGLKDFTNTSHTPFRTFLVYEYGR